MRILIKSLVLVCVALFVGVARAEEYKGAAVKGLQDRKFVFEVNGQEIQVSPGSTA